MGQIVSFHGGCDARDDGPGRHQTQHWITVSERHSRRSRVAHLCFRPATSKIENADVRNYVEKYLQLGERVLDESLPYMKASSYFEDEN